MRSFLYSQKWHLLPLLGLVGGILSFSAHGQEKLSEEGKKEAIEWVKQVKASYLSDSSVRIRRAEATLLAACASETAAMNLYVEAMKSQFLNSSSIVSRMFSSGRGARMMMSSRIRGRNGGSSSNNSSLSPTAMFSNWRKENTGGNARPGLRKALQLQFKWMLLCIKKSQAEKSGQEMDIRANAMSIVDEYASNAKDVSESMGLAASSAGVVRQHLDIADVRSEKMPESLVNISGIFAQVFCQPYKDNNDPEGLRKMWQKRIATELIFLNTLNANNKDSKNAATEAINFSLRRQVEREKECYDLGDEVQSINNLKKIIITMREPADKNSAIRSMEDMLGAKKEGMRDAESSRRRDDGRR